MLPTPLYACPVHQDWTQICNAPPDCERTILASTIGEDHAENAEQLVRIVNSHAALVATLKELLNSCRWHYIPLIEDYAKAPQAAHGHDAVLERAKAALKVATAIPSDGIGTPVPRMP